MSKQKLVDRINKILSESSRKLDLLEGVWDSVDLLEPHVILDKINVPDGIDYLEGRYLSSTESRVEMDGGIDLLELKTETLEAIVNRLSSSKGPQKGDLAFIAAREAALKAREAKEAKRAKN